MSDEVLLAAILLAAAGLLFILTIIVLCIVFRNAKNRSDTKAGVGSQIPTSKTNHHYDNYALERDANVGFYGNTPANQDPRVSYYGNEGSVDHKAEWPKTYNMYAVSRSYAFPKAGDNSSEPEIKPVQRSNPPSTRASSISRHEVQHKSFSEEVFEATLPRESEPVNRGSGIWKYRAPSETASLHSHDTGSVQGSTVSQPREHRVITEQRSYYTSFKPRKVSVSTETSSTSHQTEISNGRSSGLAREKISTHSVKSTGTKKVFTFDLKQTT